MKRTEFCLENYIKGADVAFVLMPLPIYERNLTPQERRMHSAYWNKLSELVPSAHFSTERPIFNFMEIGLGLPTLSGELKSRGYSVGLLNLLNFSGSEIDYNTIENILIDAGRSSIYLLSPMTCGYGIFKRLVNIIKSIYPDSIIMAGGPHVSKLPVRTLQDIPELDITTSEEVIFTSHIVNAMLTDSSISKFPGVFYRASDGIAGQSLNHDSQDILLDEVEIDLDILPSGYAEYSWARVYTTLGCVSNCAFCADVLHKNRSPHIYELSSVMRQIDALIERFSISLFYIGDENFTYNRQHAREFAKAMGRRHGTYWIAQTRADYVDEKTLRIMADNNCILLKFGVETGSEAIRQVMGKNISTDKIRLACRLAKKCGLNVFTYWMTGLPGETPQTLKESRQLQQELFSNGLCDLAEDVLFVPYPGTEVYSNPEKFRVVIDPKPWDEWREDMPSVINTETLTSQQIYTAWLDKIDELASLIREHR